MKKSIIPFIILMSLCLSTCVDEYHPSGMEEAGGFLIVDGAITGGESLFTLSYSVGIGAPSGMPLITNASLYVETSKGERIEGRHRQNVYTEQDINSNNPLATVQRVEQGVYSIPTGTLERDVEYRLHISVDGEEYESSFLKPLYTPEIDSLSVAKRAKGEPVVVSVTSHGMGEQSAYYRWSFYETWEVKAKYILWGYFPSGNRDEPSSSLIWFSSMSIRRPDNFYYCWGRDSSKSLMTATSERLTENLIYQYPLAEIPCDDEKLSILYHLDVRQMSIRKEAYDYFTNMQANTGQTGSIFSSIAGEINGNIRCLTNPSLTVAGFVEVTTATQKDIFIPENGLYYEPDDDGFEGSYMFSENKPPVLPFADGYPTAFRACYDCRYKYNAAKQRPPAWPTEHY
ncbi:MAG: DUF4249 domain-containing protein [Tannerellaceae bacterium]|jgi:hypothetical protein|nr:DUF4249 domain-containing protein [Tannerellaceae bacterium]